MPESLPDGITRELLLDAISKFQMAEAFASLNFRGGVLRSAKTRWNALGGMCT